MPRTSNTQTRVPTSHPYTPSSSHTGLWQPQGVWGHYAPGPSSSLQQAIPLAQLGSSNEPSPPPPTSLPPPPLVPSPESPDPSAASQDQEKYTLMLLRTIQSFVDNGRPEFTIEEDGTLRWIFDMTHCDDAPVEQVTRTFYAQDPNTREGVGCYRVRAPKSARPDEVYRAVVDVAQCDIFCLETNPSYDVGTHIHKFYVVPKTGEVIPLSREEVSVALLTLTTKADWCVDWHGPAGLFVTVPRTQRAVDALNRFGTIVRTNTPGV